MVTLHLASAETGASQGTNLLTGGIILALMSVPVIVSLAEDALRAVPDSYREAALALGANPGRPCAACFSPPRATACSPRACSAWAAPSARRWPCCSPPATATASPKRSPIPSAR